MVFGGAIEFAQGGWGRVGVLKGGEYVSFVGGGRGGAGRDARKGGAKEESYKGRFKVVIREWTVFFEVGKEEEKKEEIFCI